MFGVELFLDVLECTEDIFYRGGAWVSSSVGKIMVGYLEILLYFCVANSFPTCYVSKQGVCGAEVSFV